MKDRLLEVFKKAFETNKITESISQKNFEKWDSLNHINLVVEIENEFDIILEPEEISQMIDFRTVYEIVAAKVIK